MRSDAHLNPADVMLDNRERFFDIAHVPAKNGYLHGDFVLYIVHLRQFLACLKQLVAHFMLLGAHSMLLLAHLAKLLQDACQLFANEAQVDIFVSHSFPLPSLAETRHHP